jgi:hypothetical protein
VDYFHENYEDALATCHANPDGKQVSLGLAKDWANNPVTPERVRAVALHEVLHVLLADLKDLVNQRVCTDAMVTEAQHAIIRRLEHFILGSGQAFPTAPKAK